MVGDLSSSSAPPPAASEPAAATLSIQPVTLSDVPRVAQIHLLAWLTNACYSKIYYKGYTDATVQSMIERHTKALTTDPDAQYFKCVLSPSPSTTTDAPVLIAWTKINIFRSADSVSTRADTSPRVWPPDINQGLVDSFWEVLQSVRLHYGPRMGAHVQVDLLATDPAYFRRGAGRALMKYIVALADRERLPCFIEASPDGESLYASVGFVRVAVFWTDLGRWVEDRDRGVDWRKNKKRTGEEGEAENEGGEKEKEEKSIENGWYPQILMVRPTEGKTVADYLGEGWEERSSGIGF